MKKRAFTLVLSMFLVVLLATTGVSLALTAAIESTQAARAARDLNHQLAVDSFLLALPRLLEATTAKSLVGQDNAKRRHLSVSIAGCQIECDISDEASKRVIGKSTIESGQQLVETARSHGLPPENVRLQPIVSGKDNQDMPKFVWFDQIIEPTQFEEIFRLRLDAPIKRKPPARKSWSDLLTFWRSKSGQTLAIELHTNFGGDTRRWYLVVAIHGGDTEVLYRGAI